MNLPIFSWFFIIATVILVAGVVWDASIWFKGRFSFAAGIRGFFRTVFSRQIGTLARAFVLDVFIQRRLWREDRLRWLMKEFIIFGYVGVIMVNEIKTANRLPGLESINGGNRALDFFITPFCDYYFIPAVYNGVAHFTRVDALLAFLNDLFAGLVVAGEGIAIYRRFVKKAFPLKTSMLEVVSVMLLGGWFIFRFLAEGITLAVYHLPGTTAGYWFIGWAISKPFELAQLASHSAVTGAWIVSSLLLAALFASIPFNTKLWHIFITPLNTMLNAVPRDREALAGKQSAIPFDTRQLIELDSCMKCQICADACQITAATQENEGFRLYYSYAGVHYHLKKMIRGEHGPSRLLGGAKPSDIELADFREEVFNCLLCGRCREVCPAHIDTRSIGITNRENLYASGNYSKKMDPVIEAEKTEKNVANFPNADRAMWVDFLPEPPEDLYQKEHADVIYFVGCMASFSPVVQDIPAALAEVLDRAGVDFTIMGEEEWCCGYPLIVGGMRRETEELITHNTEAIKKIGARTMVFACPSCFHTFREEYDLPGVEMLHHTQYLKRLIDEGKIRLREAVDLSAAYHDPCDLGRNSGIYEEPRAVVQSLPGVKYQEFPDNRNMALCCGGGGDIEILDPDMATAVSKDIIDEAEEIGVSTVITACQQCKRVLKGASQRSESKPQVIDIAEVVLQAMGEREAEEEPEPSGTSDAAGAGPSAGGDGDAAVKADSGQKGDGDGGRPASGGQAPAVKQEQAGE